MAEKSRTEYSARNTTVAMAARIVAILTGYVTRVVFTHTLSEDYVGINGLFTDILNVLAMSELGVGTAITYALYKPVSQKDVEKQKSLMRLYRKFYWIVSAIVLVAGLLVVPFLGVLIKDQPQVDHLILIYLMYLLNSVMSYQMIYKRTLADAHQLSYIGVLYQTTSWIIQSLAQIAVLYFTGSYLFFLTVQILCTIGGNLAISRKADRMYPCLRDREVQPLPRRERKEIFRNIRAMLMHKVGNVLVNNTDNLLLSALVGTLSVGRYSNYFLIIGSVRQVLEQMFQGITASVGNLGVKEGKERIRKIFEASFFMGQWMYGLAAICLCEVIDSFVEVSFGAQYVFSRNITLILCLNFYLTGMRQASLVFRDSMGIFKYDQYKAIPEAVINLTVSWVLGRMMGTAGIFLGTMVSTVTTSLWVEPYMLYRHRLETSSKPYFLRYFCYASVTFLLWWGEDQLCRNITGKLWTTCVLRFLFCFVTTNLVFFALYHCTKEFRLLWQKAVGIVRKHFPTFFADKSSQRSAKELSPEESCLLKLLREQLGAQRQKPLAPMIDHNGVWQDDMSVGRTGEGAEWEMGAVNSRRGRAEGDLRKVCHVAEKHGVLSLLYDALAEKEGVPGHVRDRVTAAGRKAVQQSYRILFLSKFLIGRLEDMGIGVVLLKGVGTASFYPVPELRKTGDVDLLLLHLEYLERAEEILEQCGCSVSERQPSLHHVVLMAPGGIEVELHTMLAEPFDNQGINRYLRERIPDCGRNIRRMDCMGVVLPVLDTGYHAYELLLHMLQHFLRAGFGLRLLCDWVVFWNREIEAGERQKYLDLIRESGLKGFSDMVTSFCCAYLGLERKRMTWMEIDGRGDVEGFLREILEAEEFGRSAADRMVTLRKDSPAAYVREFHHQMCLNFPKASRCIPLWPGLWLATLVRFLVNNRKIRRVSTRAVMKKAAQRSRIMEQIGLWKE